MQNYLSDWVEKLNDYLNKEDTDQIIKQLDNNSYILLN